MNFVCRFRFLIVGILGFGHFASLRAGVDHLNSSSIVSYSPQEGLIKTVEIPYIGNYILPESPVQDLFKSWKINGNELNLTYIAGIKLKSFRAYPNEKCRIDVDFSSADWKKIKNHAHVELDVKDQIVSMLFKRIDAVMEHHLSHGSLCELRVNGMEPKSNNTFNLNLHHITISYASEKNLLTKTKSEVTKIEKSLKKYILKNSTINYDDELTPMQFWCDGKFPVKVAIRVQESTSSPYIKHHYYFKDKKLILIEEWSRKHLYNQGKLSHILDQDWQKIPLSPFMLKDEEVTYNAVVSALLSDKNLCKTK